jgi:RNA polymerase primary sigma factor
MPIVVQGDLGSEPLLTAAEELALARQIEAGVLARAARQSGSYERASDVELIMIEQVGEEARQRFIRANLRLVAMVARQAAARSRLPESDLFQEGCIGLIHAVQRFDHDRGFKFATYALFWIRAYVHAATASLLGSLNLPSSRAAQLRAVRGVEVELGQELGRTPDMAELALRLGRTEEWTASLMAHRVPEPIDLLDADELNHLSDIDATVDDVLDSFRPGAELLLHLPTLDRDVLKLRLGFVGGDVRSYAETARVLCVSVTKVRRAERRGLEVLRAICPQDAAAHL